MPRILTVTLNPAIDCAASTDHVHPTAKLRTRGQRLDPGGGGINVARVIARLGGDVEALHVAGGLTGPLLTALISETGIPNRCLPIAGDTRISLVVQETASGQEYRFVPEGPLISAAEAEALLARIAAIRCDWLVLSGSLPRGLGADVYARIIAGRAQPCQIVLDTSGPALAASIAAGGITLAKPSREEMEALVGRPLPAIADVLAAAQALVASGGVRLLVVSLGAEGAVLVGDGLALHQPAIPVAPASAVGAGDSFVAAMVWALAAGRPVADAFAIGLAGGAAAVMTPGSELAHAADIARLAATMGVTL